MTPFVRPIALLLASLLAATFALAEGEKQVVWKLVDKKGKVTYADKAPPKDYDGKVTRIEVGGDVGVGDAADAGGAEEAAHRDTSIGKPTSLASW